MSGAPVDAAVAAAVTRRQITEVMHFTTRRGLVGIFAQGKLQARAHLDHDDYLEHVYRPNSNYRREAPGYWRYVNVSISAVNANFFSISRRWHASETNLFWAVLSFDPAVLAHEGVLFATSNMAYDGVVPAAGEPAFEALFAERAHDGFGRHVIRPAGKPDHEPTTSQAEALYPDALSTRYLRRVYVGDDADAAEVESIVGAVGHDDVHVLVQPALFGH